VLEAETQTWHSSLNTAERVKIEAAHIIERALPVLDARISDPGEGLNAVTEAIKTTARLAGLGEKVTGDGNSEKFVISINLSAAGEPKVITLEKDLSPVIEHEPMGEVCSTKTSESVETLQTVKNGES